MKWHYKRKPVVNKNPWNGWVKVRFLGMPHFTFGIFIPRICGKCDMRFWLEPFYHKNVNAARMLQCFECNMLDKLGGTNS